MSSRWWPEHQGVAGAQQAFHPRTSSAGRARRGSSSRRTRVVAEVVVGIALMGLDDRGVDAGARRGDPSG